MSGVELTEHVEGIVHEDTQVGDHGLDLTVAGVHEIEEPGRVDFGGGELEAASTTSHETEKRNPDDDYEWWNLDAGQYLVLFNESVHADEPLVCQAREELRNRGAFHPTLFVRELERVPLSVPTGGIRLKENARVSTLLVPPRS
ncbi:dCTP deaminase/dUTPase family protein [Halococcus agarilyticus]|uniref:dCTP deaminase n=1 Tax=Halococcus agarilyticus TaxID=1232219 RepID=UPI000677D82A|nr:dCTP deaminase [Halococcus agarilyticus]